MLKSRDSEGHSKGSSFLFIVHSLWWVLRYVFIQWPGSSSTASLQLPLLDCVTFVVRICWYLVESILPSTCAMFAFNCHITPKHNRATPMPGEVLFSSNAAPFFLQTWKKSICPSPLFSTCFPNASVWLCILQTLTFVMRSQIRILLMTILCRSCLCKQHCTVKGCSTTPVSAKSFCMSFAVMWGFCCAFLVSIQAVIPESFLGLPDLILASTVPLNCHFFSDILDSGNSKLKVLWCLFIALPCFVGISNIHFQILNQLLRGTFVF